MEELLRAVHDNMLLSLSVDSHASRRRLSDVDRHFQALKVKIADDSGGIHVDVDHDLKAVLGDNLSARFAALKAPMHVPSSSSIAASHDEDNIDDDVDEEVEKLMRWAKDAARLDPSPPSDDED